MEKKFKSTQKELIKGFLTLKRLTLKYRKEENIFSLYDRMLVENNITSLGVTKSFASIWVKKRDHESMRYVYDRIRIINEYSRFLQNQGISSFIMQLPRFIRSTFRPYIYNHEEKTRIFKKLDELRLVVKSMNSALFSIPALIRFLYGTGVRIGEALALKDKDIDLDRKVVRVKDSKNGNYRIIPITDSLCNVCSQYMHYRNCLPLVEHPERFFIKIDGSPIQTWDAIGYWFKRCLLEVNLHGDGIRQSPRIHDIRHTAAVDGMVNMTKKGLNINYALPILSTYLGHQSIKSTNHYVRTVEAMLPEIRNKLNSISEFVLPKF